MVRWQSDLVYTIQSILSVCDQPYHMNNGFQQMWAEIKNLWKHAKKSRTLQLYGKCLFLCTRHRGCCRCRRLPARIWCTPRSGLSWPPRSPCSHTAECPESHMLLSEFLNLSLSILNMGTANRHQSLCSFEFLSFWIHGYVSLLYINIFS